MFTIIKKEVKIIKEYFTYTTPNGKKYEIPYTQIRNFMYETCVDMEKTIENDDYTYDYIYFDYGEEEMERLLLELDIIRYAPMYEYINKRINEGKSKEPRRYWLSNGYHNLKDKILDVL